MAISVDQVDLWRQLSSETEHLEFKEAKNQFDNSKLFSYCVAIANEGGGHLLLGINNIPPRIIVGTKAFNNPADMAGKMFEKLGFRVDVEEVAHPDGRVVVFIIPGRPRGTAFHLDGAYLMRSGESLVPMSEDRPRAIFAEGEPAWLEDHAMTGLVAEQVMDLLDTQQFFTLLNLPYPSSVNAVIDRLVGDRLVDKISGKYAIRRIGAIALAKLLAPFPELARKGARVIVYRGVSKLETLTDSTATRGYATGFQALVKYVVDRLPQNEVIQDALRTEVKWISEIAIRELLANALIHQDFNLHGTSVMAEIYDNRIEISSPGSPLVPVERFIDGYQSRNERLADLMRRLRICEEKSSGVDRVINAAEVYQLPAPDFRAGHQRTISIIFGPRPFEEMDRDDRIRACYQHCALKQVMSEKMTNQSLRERFHLPEAKSTVVSQVIAMTMEIGSIKLDEKSGGSRKFARYVPFWA
jgi:ATP-dependent DNA helicase RecG